MSAGSKCVRTDASPCCIRGSWICRMRVMIREPVMPTNRTPSGRRPRPSRDRTAANRGAS
jgi:hypothetical protein